MKVNSKEVEIVRLSFTLCLISVESTRIASLLDCLGVSIVIGRTREGGSISGTIANEKYKGDAQLQKSYTVDFLTKKRAKNVGEVRIYYVEDDHEVIIDPRYENEPVEI